MVLVTNYFDRRWYMNGDEYEGITWEDSSPKPTQAELDSQWPEVKYRWECARIERDRLAAYEKESDPIFFKWQRGDATEAEWREAVAKVKAENPYPPAP
jgi:hypothetical protein